MLTWVSPTWRDLKRLQCIQSLKSIEFSVQIFFALFRLQFFANWSCWNNLKRRKYSLRVWIMLTIFTWYSTTKKYVFITSKSNNLCFEFVWLKVHIEKFYRKKAWSQCRWYEISGLNIHIIEYLWVHFFAFRPIGFC